jgi:serine/threonine protein kinase
MSSEALRPEDRFGKYQVVRLVATGGMGTVYKAQDLDLGRVVALKVISPERAARANVVERFRREARHAARLKHKNVVTVYEFGQAEGQWYLAMEFVEGVDLDTFVVRKGPLDPDRARRILKQAVKALDHAYQMGVTHRDIKPANLLLTNEEGQAVVKLTDFGLAQVEDEEQFRLTRDGSTVGTIDYLSPEQARDSAAADIRSDIYSLGCTFYHILAGHPPFPDGGIGERVYKHMEVEPPDIRAINPRVSAALWAVLTKMLAKKPEDRYQTPAEILQALRDAKQGIVPSAPMPTPTPESLPVPTPTPVPETVDDPVDAPPHGAAVQERAERRKHRQVSRPVVLDSTFILGLTAEQVRAAAGQYDRSRQAREAGNEEYALELLLSCCKLDPSELRYREALREVSQFLVEQSRTKHRPGALSALATRTRFHAARHRQDHRKVLEHGETLLLRDPADVGIQADMAEAADELGLPAIAIWMLEQAHEQVPDNMDITRRLARLYERQRRLPLAIELWQAIHKADPDDHEALAKIRDLSVNDTIARGGYKR